MPMPLMISEIFGQPRTTLGSLGRQGMEALGHVYIIRVFEFDLIVKTFPNIPNIVSPNCHMIVCMREQMPEPFEC